MTKDASPVIWFEKLGRADVPRIGGKNASLGEMVRNLDKKGVRVPPGIAPTADAYWRFIADNVLRPVIAGALSELACGKAPQAERPRSLRDVRDSFERHPRQGLRRALRWLLDRQQ